MDTDSAYIAFSAEKIEDLIKPESKEDYILNENDWFTCDDTTENANNPERLDYLNKNMGVDQLWPHALRCITMKVLTMEIKNINLAQTAFQKIKTILPGNDLKKHRQTKLKNMHVLITDSALLIIT